MFSKNTKKTLFFKTLLFLGIILGMGGSLFSADFASAQSCPANTTVSGTTVNFVGEVTDMGGDSVTYAWFEYGETTSYGQKTSERSLTSTGFYCISVSGLSPNTTYYYRAVASNSAGTSYGERKSFTTVSGPTVDIKANGSNGPITVPYNGSATLSWTSSDVDYCSASGGWSGSKGMSGSQVIQNLTVSRTYTLNCSGAGGSVSDSVKVNVEEDYDYADFSIKKTVRNLSKGTVYSDLIYADPGDILTFGIVVKAGSDSIYDIVVKDILPAGIIYRGDLKVDNILTGGDIFAGLNIGHLAAGQKKTVTFRGDVAGAESFSFGQTQLINTASVSSGADSRSDSAKILVTRGVVAGVATAVSTGLTNNVFLDSFLLPLMMSLLIIWLFKSRIIKFEEWLDRRKKEYQIYKSKKILQLKVARIKAQEFLGKIV